MKLLNLILREKIQRLSARRPARLMEGLSGK